MVGLINTIACTYVLEREDVYMECWWSHVFDCDETMMLYRLFILFTLGPFRNPVLEEMRQYALHYIPFTSFWYVKTASTSDVNSFGKLKVRFAKR